MNMMVGHSLLKTVVRSARVKPIQTGVLWSDKSSSFPAQFYDQSVNATEVKAVEITGRNMPLILLADDDPDDRELFQEVISEINNSIAVKTVGNGIELMRVLTEAVHDLPGMIFLDLNMPGKGGIECLREIRKTSSLARIPIVIYTTSSNQRDIIQTHGLGANLYFPKPNNIKILISVLTQILSLDPEKLTSIPPISQYVVSTSVM